MRYTVGILGVYEGFTGGYGDTREAAGRGKQAERAGMAWVCRTDDRARTANWQQRSLPKTRSTRTMWRLLT